MSQSRQLKKYALTITEDFLRVFSEMEDIVLKAHGSKAMNAVNFVRSILGTKVVIENEEAKKNKKSKPAPKAEAPQQAENEQPAA